MTAAVDFYNREGAHIPPGEYDFAKEVVVQGILRGVISRAGAFYTYEDRKWQGAPKLLASIREEPDLKDRMIDEVMEAIGVVEVEEAEDD